MAHSGFVADVAFYNLTERLMGDYRSFWVEHGVKGYWRYRDDGFLICSCREGVKKFCDWMQGKAKYFRMECEKVDDHEVLGRHGPEARCTLCCESDLEADQPPTPVGGRLSTSSACAHVVAG